MTRVKKITAHDEIQVFIPLDMLEEAGLHQESVMQVRAGKGKIIIDAVKDVGDMVCDHDCADCPIQEICKKEDCDV